MFKGGSLVVCKEIMQEKLLIKFYSVGVSLLLKTSPWWLKVQSEGKTITFNLLILKLITDTQKKCVMTSASPSVKWTYLLMPFVKSALYLLYCLWGLTFWFLYFCLLLEKFISQFCWIEGCHFFRKEHEWMLRSVYGMKSGNNFQGVGMLTWVSKNAAVVWNLIV